MVGNFMMGTTSSITVLSLGEIEQHAPAVGAKIGVCRGLCLFYVTLRGRRAVRSRGYILSRF